jgi:hypothetical protein
MVVFLRRAAMPYDDASKEVVVQQGVRGCGRRLPVL